uniref:Sushi domain-containing protein n=1 Tax=Electrophorus electricus TaxID=8005 RepID=A0A4W4EXH3_ELEEL
MESSLVILYIFFFVRVYTTQTACPMILPVVENADVSDTSLKNNYSEGDELLYICQEGYVSLRRIIYVCDGHHWVTTPNSKCKRCELPADIPNGHYIIVHGTDFVYGATIKYICKEGYQMVSRVNTRTCLAGGWDDRLPICQEISCSPPQLGGKITVDGLTDYEKPLREGHRLQFVCDSPGLKLVGPREVTCQENGEWSSSFPRCEEVTCQLGEINDSLSVVGLPEQNAPAKFGHKLQFYCTDPKLSLRGSKEVTCSAGGSWSSPFPICENTYHYCNGGCGPPPHIEFAETTTFQKTYYRPDETVQYICHNYYKQDGNPYMTCTQGKWKRGYLRCLKPCTLTIKDMDKNKIQQYYGPKQLMYSWHMQYITFKCQPGTKPTRESIGFRQKCTDGVMPLPICQ